jgi:membrane-associated protein
MRRRRRYALLAGVGVLVVVAVVVVLQLADDGNAFGLVDVEGAAGWEYLTIFALIAADAVFPVFPSESALNTASTMASAGELDLAVVIVTGALGAVAGDSLLYWIARLAGARVESKLEKAKRNDKVAAGLELMGRSAPLLIVGGRFVPGLRFVVNASMGLAAYPYRRFLLWSVVGGVSWSVYTCVLAYVVGTALADFPLASIVISGTVTSVFLVALFFVARRRRGATADEKKPFVEPASS